MWLTSKKYKNETLLAWIIILFICILRKIEYTQNEDDFSLQEEGTIAEIICKDGYAMTENDDLLVCEDGSWSGPVGNCTALSCDELTIVHGTVKYTDTVGILEFGERQQNSIAIFTCDKGYILT